METDDQTDEPVIPWHYLGTTGCLIGGPGARAAGSPTLMEMLGNMSEAELLAALAPDQTGRSEGGLMALVRRIGAGTDAGKRYRWDHPWPTTIPVLLRKGLPDGDLFLSPNSLVVPFPLPDDASGELARKLEQVQESAPHPEADLSSPHGLQLDAFMRAADDAVTKDKYHEAFTEARSRPGGAKAWIVDHARTQYGYDGLDYPESVSVTVEDRPTTETAWRVQDRHLDLALGWIRVGKPAGKDPKSILLDQWPCGAFVYPYPLDAAKPVDAP